MSNRDKPAIPIPPRAQTWMLASLALVILPHTLRLPWWIPLFALGIGLYHLISQRPPGRNTPRPVVMILTVAATAGVFLQYGTLLGRNAGVALLVIMLVLKLLEMRTTRDGLVVIFLSYFLVITNFLFTQTPFIAIYMLVTTVVITATLSVTSHASPARPATGHLRLAMILLGQALPVMAVLFIFFPRVIGPIWGLPEDAHAGLTGLSDSMNPGAISSLAQSGELAFRVKFTGAAPEPARRYWRGPVLWHTDGRTWSAIRFDARTKGPGNEVRLAGAPLQYEITLEAHNQRWLFALDLPTAVSIPATRTAGFQWLANQRLRERTRYQATSYPHYNTGPLSRLLRNAGLQLPDTVSPRIRNLVREWRDDSDSDREMVQQALDYFNTRPFVYTLTPPRLGDNPVDEFLFTTRRGFCEHYASAFVLLMRTAGIPARVVTGYQGGEYNPMGEYWVVRQSDAHAWAEVWLEGSGWVRVDPTAAVAPERIERALDLLEQPSGAPARFQLAENGLLASGWRGLRHSLDALNNGWNQWVLSYGPAVQLRLLSAMGIDHPSWKHMALALLVLTSTLLGGMALWMLVKAPRQSDPVLRAWERFRARLSRAGMQMGLHEGPRDFARRVGEGRPELAPKVDAITTLYIQLRYGRSPADRRTAVNQLVELVKRF